MSYEAKTIWHYNAKPPIPQIRQAIEKIYKLWLRKHSTDDDLILYHYTTVQGLAGIIRNRSLWLTNTSSLNDPSELIYGKDLIQNMLGEEFDKQDDEAIKKYIDLLKRELNMFDKIMYETYVACFCESDNSLSQWRGYATSGRGYNLGFEFSSDTKFYHALDASKVESVVILRKVIYEVAEQKQILSEYLSILLSYVNDVIRNFKNLGEIQEGWENRAAMESANVLIDLMFSFKNPGFKEEKEWRLIKTRQAKVKANQLQFREKNSGLIPYIDTHVFEKKMEKTIFLLRSVTCGPMLEDSNAKSAINLLIEKESVSNCDIEINPNEISINSAGYSLR